MLLATAESPVCRLGSFHSQTFLLVFSGGDGQATLQMSPRVLTDTFQATPRASKGYQGVFQCGPPSPGDHSGGVSELWSQGRAQIQRVALSLVGECG